MDQSTTSSTPNGASPAALSTRRIETPLQLSGGHSAPPNGGAPAQAETSLHLSDSSLLGLMSAIGSGIGALILLALSNPSFQAMVPWLLFAATALFAAGPWLRPKGKAVTSDHEKASLFALILQFLTSIYGGFFGAGMGVMMLATLGLTQSGDYHHLNALKNLFATIIAAVAIVVFVGGGVVAWREAVVMIPAVALGGYAGVWAARRVPQGAVRTVVVAVGLLLAVYYFARV